MTKDIIYKCKKDTYVNSHFIKKGEVVSVTEYHLIVNKDSYIQFIISTGHYLRMTIKNFLEKFEIEKGKIWVIN